MLKQYTVVYVDQLGEHIKYTKGDLTDPKSKMRASSDYTPQEYESLLAFSLLSDSFRKLMGKTLTIIDASIIDKQQNKSIKDLIRGVYSEELGFVSSLVYDQKGIQEQLPED